MEDIGKNHFFIPIPLTNLLVYVKVIVLVIENVSNLHSRFCV